MIRDDRPIFLVGFMGSGKTAVGQVLARRLGWTLRDTDRMIEQREGRSIETIFLESGEADGLTARTRGRSRPPRGC